MDMSDYFERAFSYRDRLKEIRSDISKNVKQCS
jgi:hypothetical protein